MSGAADDRQPIATLAAEETPRSSAPLWATVIATFFGAGRMRPGPGTWGSAATVLLWAGIAYFLRPEWRTPVAIAAALIVILIGIPAATQVARATGAKDPQFVVIDEVAGQWIALMFSRVNLSHLLAGFLLFRLFDIVKPWPARRLEHLPGGWGIMLDDVAAGVYALLLMLALNHWIG